MELLVQRYLFFSYVVFLYNCLCYKQLIFASVCFLQKLAKISPDNQEIVQKDNVIENVLYL